MSASATQVGHKKCSAVAQTGERLVTIDTGRKIGGAVALLRKELGPHLTQCGLGRPYLHTKWHLEASSCLATISMGQKLGGLSPFGDRELGPHLAQSCLDRGLPPYQLAS